jgi:hypothetical protein
LLAPRPTHKLEDHPSSAVRGCLFNLFTATLYIGGRSSIRNLRTRHAVVAGTHICTVGFHYNTYYLCPPHPFVSLSYFGLPAEISSRTKMYLDFVAKLRSCKLSVANFCSQLFMPIFLSTPVIALLLLSPLSFQIPSLNHAVLRFSPSQSDAIQPVTLNVESHFWSSLCPSHSCTSTFSRYVRDAMSACNWLAARVLPSFGCP